MRRFCVLAALALIASCSTAGSTPVSTDEASATSFARSTADAERPRDEASKSSLPPAQRKYIAALRKAGEFDADDTEEEMIELGKDFCGTSDNPDNLYTDHGGNPPDVEEIATYKDSMGAIEKNAVLHLCPKYIKTWKQAMNGFDDGDHVVGKDIKPGTYRTLDKGLKGCYWERVTKGGATIANQFVSYSPGHITVTIAPTDGGFSSTKKCYFWVPASLD